ncbi:MAG: hypothetical protein VYD18_16525 [Candidatus Latescibacterota bacterium]|nr:hypothetical protein [Candidatus Latescibacterota bacterium]
MVAMEKVYHHHQQVILDRWNPLRLNKKIASHFGLTINQVRHIRSKPAFQAEYSKQLAIDQRSFDEIQLADRKERVMAMQELFEKIPDIRVALKLKILAQIRAEVGQDHRRVSSVQAASRSRASRTI